MVSYGEKDKELIALKEVLKLIENCNMNNTKGKTFGEIYPKGKCMFCGGECNAEYIMHYDCAVAYEQKRRAELKADK